MLRQKEEKTEIHPPCWLLREAGGITCTQINGAIGIQSCKRSQRTETKVVRILIFGLVAVEVLVALFLVLLKKKTA